MKKSFIIVILLFTCHLCFSQTKIGTINSENILELFKQNNNLCYTYVEEKAGVISILQEFYCNINGKKYGPFSKQPIIKKNINAFYIEFCIDDKYGYIINNTVFGPYEDLDKVIYNNDGTKFSFVYSEDHVYYLIENGKVIDKKAYIDENSYNANNTLCYCYAEEIDQDYPEIFVKVGNETFGPYSDYDRFEFNENGEYYIKVEDEYDDDYVLFNGKLYAKNDFNEEWFAPSDFLKDSEGFYYQTGNQRTESYDELDYVYLSTFFEHSDITILKGKKDNQTYIIKNFKTIYGPYTDERFNNFYLEKGTNSLYYNVEKNNKYYLYKDGKIIDTSTQMIYPIFSENANVCFYQIKDSNGKYWLSTGKEKAGPYDSITDISISKDGTKIAYVVKINGKNFIFDGIKKLGPFDWITDIAISPDNTLAYAYENNDEYFLVYKDQKYGPYFFIEGDITFSDDGKHIATFKKNPGSLAHDLLVDGKVIGTIDERDSFTIVFSKNGLHTLCYSLYSDLFFYDGKLIDGKRNNSYPFYTYNILTYTEEHDNKTITHLIINNQDFKGQFLSDDFIYLDGKNIMYIKN